MRKFSRGFGLIGLLISLAIAGYLLTLAVRRNPTGEVAIPQEIGKDLGIDSAVSSSKATIDAVQKKLDTFQENMKARQELIENGE